MKNEPRYVPQGGALIEVSNRTMLGRFLSRPSAEVNDLILGVLGRAQRLHGVTIFAFVFLSDHYHMLVWVKDAEQLASFMNYFQGNVALELRRLHGWPGKVWEKPYFSAVVKDSEASQLARLHYILSNGCKESLVASPRDWPGASSTPALLDGSMELVGTWFDRTAENHARRKGEHKLFPERETVKLSPLPCMAHLSSSEFHARMEALVVLVEVETANRHKFNGTRPLGRQHVLRQHPLHVPAALKRTRARRFLAAKGESVAELQEAFRVFLARYREASKLLRSGVTDAVFPAGCFPPRLPFNRGGPREAR